MLLMVHAVVGENGYLAGLRAQREYDSVMAQLVKLRLENQQLKEQARRLKEDPTAIEDAARRDLGLVRPGETLVIVKDVGSPPTVTSGLSTATTPTSEARAPQAV